MAVYDSYVVCVQDEDNLITWSVAPHVDGELNTGGTNCVATLYKLDGAGASTATGSTETDAAPDARGVFSGSFTEALTEGALYYLYCEYTLAAATREGIGYLAVPVRTT